jgi:hypothetical protein
MTPRLEQATWVNIAMMRMPMQRDEVRRPWISWAPCDSSYPPAPFFGVLAQFFDLDTLDAIEAQVRGYL